MEEKDAHQKKREDKVEDLKAMQFLGNLHKLTPKVADDSSRDNIAIIEALKSSSILQKKILELKGYAYDPIEKAFIKYRDPVMNSLGIGNFLASVSCIAETIEFSSFKEEEIPQLAMHFFKINYPYFTVYYDDYELDKKDFNLIATILFAFIISSFHKAKGAGHRNVVRGTYSEDLMGRVFREGDLATKQKSGFDFSKLNPFKKPKSL